MSRGGRSSMTTPERAEAFEAIAAALRGVRFKPNGGEYIPALDPAEVPFSVEVTLVAGSKAELLCIVGDLMRAHEEGRE